MSDDSDIRFRIWDCGFRIGNFLNDYFLIYIRTNKNATTISIAAPIDVIFSIRNLKSQIYNPKTRNPQQ